MHWSHGAFLSLLRNFFKPQPRISADHVPEKSKSSKAGARYEVPDNERQLNIDRGYTLIPSPSVPSCYRSHANLPAGRYRGIGESIKGSILARSKPSISLPQGSGSHCSSTRWRWNLRSRSGSTRSIKSKGGAGSMLNWEIHSRVGTF